MTCFCVSQHTLLGSALILLVVYEACRFAIRLFLLWWINDEIRPPDKENP
jgi:hypothetical protein